MSGPFKLSFVKAGKEEKLTDSMTLEKLVLIQQIEDKENFVGTICYEGSFQIEKVTGETELLLNTVYEGARVSVNGSKKGVKICPPYLFDISEAHANKKITFHSIYYYSLRALRRIL